MDQALRQPDTVMDSAPRPLAPPTLAVVIPTFNEVDNVELLARALDTALDGIAWEAVFVDDDSTDGTLDRLQDLSRSDPRIRYLHRIGRRGLSSAVVEGMLSTNTPFLAVIDSDLQHDESKLPDMLALLQSGECDVVVGSRYTGGGGVGDWSSDRQRMSRVATKLADFVLPVHLSDPMSGFFAITRPAFLRSVRTLSKQGYKILLDILLSAPAALTVREVPYTFRSRIAGESKLDSTVIVDYLMMLIDKSIGHIVPARFVLFGAVGAAGVVVHFMVLSALLMASASFIVGQAVATLVAMTFNFFVNNVLTYRDKRLKGFGKVARGLLAFYVICSLGAVSNVGVASVLFERDYAWWLSAIAGIAVGVVWNYAMTATFTWKK